MLILTACCLFACPLQDDDLAVLVEQLADPARRSEAMTRLLRLKKTAHPELKRMVDDGIANADAARAARRAVDIFDRINRIIAETDCNEKSAVMKELARAGREGAVAVTQWLRDNAVSWSLDSGYIREALRAFGPDAIDELVALLAAVPEDGREGTARDDAVQVLVDTGARHGDEKIAAALLRAWDGRGAARLRAGASAWLFRVGRRCAQDGVAPTAPLLAMLKSAEMQAAVNDEPEVATAAALLIRRAERWSRLLPAGRRFEFSAEKKSIDVSLEEGEEFLVSVPYDGGPVFPRFEWNERLDDRTGTVLGPEQLPRAAGRASCRVAAIRPGKATLLVTYGGGEGDVPEAGRFDLTLTVTAGKEDARVDRLRTLLDDHAFDPSLVGIVLRIRELGEKRLTGDLVRHQRVEWAGLFNPALETLAGRTFNSPAEWRAWWKETGR